MKDRSKLESYATKLEKRNSEMDNTIKTLVKRIEMLETDSTNVCPNNINGMTDVNGEYYRQHRQEPTYGMSMDDLFGRNFASIHKHIPNWVFRQIDKQMCKIEKQFQNSYSEDSSSANIFNTFTSSSPQTEELPEDDHYLGDPLFSRHKDRSLVIIRISIHRQETYQ